MAREVHKYGKRKTESLEVIDILLIWMEGFFLIGVAGGVKCGEMVFREACANWRED